MTTPRFNYAATLFRRGGTVAPPAGRPAPALPTPGMIPGGWPLVTTEARGPVVRIGFAHAAACPPIVAFWTPAAGFPGGRTLDDFRGVLLQPAPVRD